MDDGRAGLAWVLKYRRPLLEGPGVALRPRKSWGGIRDTCLLHYAGVFNGLRLLRWLENPRYVRQDHVLERRQRGGRTKNPAVSAGYLWG